MVNGPNLNMLGKRPHKHYGTLTLEDIIKLLKEKFANLTFDFFQSNHEGNIIDYIQNANADAILINPAAYTHTSVAIRDALEIKTCLKVEVHLSDINRRELFRQINYISDVVDATFSGKKEQSYIEAIEFILSKVKK